MICYLKLSLTDTEVSACVGVCLTRNNSTTNTAVERTRLNAHDKGVVWLKGSLRWNDLLHSKGVDSSGGWLGWHSSRGWLGWLSSRG